MFKRKGVAAQWLGTYSLLLIIPIVISAIIFAGLGKTAKKQAYKTNMVILNSVKSNVDDNFLALKKTCVELSLDADLKKTLRAFDKSHQDGMIQAGELWNRTKQIISLNDYVDEVYIGFVNRDIALYSNGGIHNLEAINNVVFGQNGSRELSYVVEESGKGAFCGLNVEENKKSKDIICYVAKVSKDAAGSDTEAVIVACANVQRMKEKIIDMTEAGRSDIAVLDENGRLLFSTDDNIDIDVLKRENAMYIENGEVVSFLDLDEVGEWCCVAVTPRAIFWGDVAKLRFLCGMGLLFSMLLGGIYAVYILKKNYKPINNILERVGKNKEKNFLKGENEYDILLDVLLDAINEASDSKLIATERGKIIRDIHLRELLQNGAAGCLTREDVLEITSPSKKFAVLVFDVIKVSEQSNEEQNTDPLHITECVMREIIGKFYLCNIVKVSKYLVALVGFPNEANLSQRELTEAVDVGCSVLKENFDIALNVTVSGICNGENEIANGYREALEMLEFAKFSEKSGVVACDDADVNNGYYYSAEKDMELSGCIKIGNAEKAKKVIDEIFRFDFEKNKMTGKSKRCLIISVAATVLKSTGDEAIRMKIADICYSQDDIQKVKEEIIAAVEAICEKNVSELRGHSEIEAIKEYITEHYYDQNLTIQTIGENFGWSPYYLSRTFKNETDIGIIEYIRHIRVEKAKEIMEKLPFIRLEELAERVGMNGSRTLSRAFKNELGILPAEYKKTLSKKDKE